MTATLTATDVAMASIRAIEALDLAACQTYFHPEAGNREAAAEPPDCRRPGPAGAYATAQWLHHLAADINWEIHEAITEGDLVAVHATMRGHQSNPHTIYAPDGSPAQVMPNHGRPFAVTQTHWYRVKDGLVFDHWANRDDLGMAMQLGWFPPPAP